LAGRAFAALRLQMRALAWRLVRAVLLTFCEQSCRRRTPKRSVARTMYTGRKGDESCGTRVIIDLQAARALARKRRGAT
jgi:hypothetical protein